MEIGMEIGRENSFMKCYCLKYVLSRRLLLICRKIQFLRRNRSPRKIICWGREISKKVDDCWPNMPILSVFLPGASFCRVYSNFLLKNCAPGKKMTRPKQSIPHLEYERGTLQDLFPQLLYVIFSTVQAKWGSFEDGVVILLTHEY